MTFEYKVVRIYVSMETIGEVVVLWKTQESVIDTLTWVTLFYLFIFFISYFLNGKG